MKDAVADPIAPAALDTSGAAAREWMEPVRVITHMRVTATPAQVWDSLMFYESIEGTPPPLLRLLLPRPIRTQGAKSAVGDRATCLYQGGHLLKQVTRIEPGRLYEFCVLEQHLAVGRTVRLSGGSYSLHELSPEQVQLSIMTRYTSANRPRLLARPAEAAVCHLFHRHLLGAIRRKAESLRERP
ncbi:MAG TPA: hypothetical protein VMB48_11350 [Steroidobacteraceae bacterium]|nr:hypothetical protein [Steroidobacteraceae bacterium]